MTSKDTSKSELLLDEFELIADGPSLESLTPAHAMAENGASVTDTQIANCSCASCSSSNQVESLPVSEQF